jgi:NTP pyrophosphatase (non-canonical NTP hydrolase)
MSNTYIQDAVRTESGKFHPVDQWTIERVLATFIAAAQDLDDLKKAIFYGKNLERYKLKAETPLTQRQVRLMHGILGLATEAGELAEALHNHIFEGQGLDLLNLLEELGDQQWYQAILCDEFGFTFEQIQGRNIAKLRKRFPEKFTEEAAINRDVEAEQKELAL